MKRWVWAMFAVELCAQSARAHAQPEDALSGVLRIQSQAAPCLTETALRERVLHWLAPRAPAKGVTVVVDAGADPPAFRVWRGGAVIAVRHFALLPSACADRLDAIALPVALAIEQATEAKDAPVTAAGTPVSAEDSATAAAPTGTTTPDSAENPGEAAANASGAASPEAARPDATAATAAAAATPKPSAAADADANTRAPSDADASANADANPNADADASTTGAAGDQAPGAALQLRLFAGGSLWFEALPHTVVAVEAGPELLFGEHLSVSLGALVTAQTEHALGNVRSQAQVFGGRALLCASWPLAGFGFDTCAGAVGGAVAVSTDGSSAGQTLAWVAGIARTALRYPARGVLSARLGLSGLLNAVRPRLLAQGAPPHEAAAGVFGAETSIELLIALP